MPKKRYIYTCDKEIHEKAKAKVNKDKYGKKSLSSVIEGFLKIFGM